jgi:hypothetical protein
VQEFERREGQIEPRACRESALRFSVDAFREHYARYVRTRFEEFRSGRAPRLELTEGRRAYG